MRLISYFLVAAISLIGGGLYGYYRHAVLTMDELTMQGYLKIMQNARLEEGDIAHQIRLNEIEIHGALGFLADRKYEGLYYAIAGRDSKYLLDWIITFLIRSDEDQMDTVLRSEKALIDYYKKKPLDFSALWNCDDLTTEEGESSCALYKESKERNKRIERLVE